MRNLKKVLSLTLALVMLLGMMVVGAGAASFKDYDTISDDYKIAAAVLDEIGVMEGTDGNFNPKNELTRVEGAALIYRLVTSGLSKNPAGDSGFTDVDGTASFSWASGTVAACRDLGIVSGESATSFNPGGKLTGSAFAKMLLVTLGYESDKQKYEGEGWASNVARDARTRGILLEAQNMSDVLTREEAAQMAFQALTADTMEYTGMNISVGDATFSSPATVRKYASVNGTDGGQKTYNYVDIEPATTPIKLCEEKFPALKLANTEDETFGRAQEVWTWKNVEIDGTKVNVEPDATFTAATDEAGVKKEIGKATSRSWREDDGTGTIVTRYGADKYTNGQLDSGVRANAKEIADLTGNGRVVEVYLGKDNKALITKVVVVDTALGEVTKVDTKTEKITIKLERHDIIVDGAAVEGPVDNAPALTTAVGYGDFQKGDMVLVQGYYNGNGSAAKPVNPKLNSKTTVTSVVEAPKVVGLARQKNYSNTTITVDGEARKMSYGFVKNYGFTPFTVSNTYDCTLYLDGYNNIIKAIPGVKTNVAEDNLIAVNDFYTTLENGKIVQKVSGVRSNGETETLTVPDGHADVTGQICTKTDNKNGTYTVAPVGTSSSITEKRLYVAETGVLPFNSRDSYGRGNGSTYMYADDVKFIFVENDGTTTVLNGRQTHTTGSGTVVAQAARNVKRDGNHLRFEIVAVFIQEQPDMIDISDIIYVHKGSSEDTQVSDDVVDDKDGTRKTIYGYVAYDSNGEPIENFYGTKDDMAHKFFRKNTTTIGEDPVYTVYRDTKPTSLGRHTVEDATVRHQNGLRGDAFVIGDGTRFLGGGAQLVDLSGGYIEDISDLNEMAAEYNIVVSVIYNSNSGNDGTMSALTIFVESVNKKPTAADNLWGTPANPKTEATLTTVNEGDEIEIPAGKTLTVTKDMVGKITFEGTGKLIVNGNMYGEVDAEDGVEIEVKGDLGGKVTVAATDTATITVEGDLTETADVTVSPETVVKVSGEQRTAVKVVKPASYTSTNEWGIFKDDKGVGVRVLTNSWSGWAGNSQCKYSWAPILVRWSELSYDDAVATYKHTNSGTTYKHVIVSLQDASGNIIYQELAGTGLTVINTNPTNTAAYYYKNASAASTLATGTPIRVTAYVLKTPIDEDATPVGTAVNINDSSVVGEKLVDFTCVTPSAS